MKYDLKRLSLLGTLCALFLFGVFASIPFALAYQLNATSQAPATSTLPHVFTDGVANTGFQRFVGNVYQVTLSTKHTGDLIVVFLNEANVNTLTSSQVSSITDSAGLNWQTRVNKPNAQAAGFSAVFYAYSTQILSKDKITLVTSADSTEHQLTAFAMHGVVSFDSSPLLPIATVEHGSKGKISFNTTSGGEVLLAYFAPHHIVDTIGFPRNYIPITFQTTGQWFYLSFKAAGANATSPTQKWTVSPADNIDLMGDAMVRGG